MNRKLITVSLVIIVLAAVGSLYAAIANSCDYWRFNDVRLLQRNGDLHEWAESIEAGLGERTVATLTASTTLTAAQSGSTIVCDGNDAGAGNVIASLPTAAPGLFYRFADANATADDDLYIKAGAADTINGGTAAQYLACKTDSAGQSVTLEAIDETRWIITAVSGTWVADSAPD